MIRICLFRVQTQRELGSRKQVSTSVQPTAAGILCRLIEGNLACFLYGAVPHHHAESAIGVGPDFVGG